MKAFFGLTAHTIDENWNAKSYLLGCNRIHGHHTAPNIFNSYETATNKFQINDKITHNITDNAANMVCAFKKISFMSKKVINGILHEKLDDIEKSNLEDIIEEELVEEETDDETSSQLSADNTMCDVSVDEESTLTPPVVNKDDIFADIFNEPESPDRESCISHSLQLVIKDALKGQTKIEAAVEHVAKLIASASSSYLIKSRLELLNGFLGKRCQTRWNSEYLMIRSFLKFSDSELETIFIDNTTTVLPADKRALLEELILVLDGFYEATLCLQKEAFSVGHVLPLYRGFKF